jgi:hypothetical protein
MGILVPLYLLSAGLDLYVTNKVLKLNPELEFNGLCRWLTKQLKSPLLGALGGSLIPRLTLLALVWTHPMACAFLTGLYLNHSGAQIWALRKGLL